MKKIKMNRTIAYGISNGVLGATLALICAGVASLEIPALHIAAWPGFVAWACYFAAGGTFKEGVLKVLPAATVGMLMAAVMLAICVLLGGGYMGLGIGVCIGAFFIVVESAWRPLSFTPGIFSGCACAFGFGVSFGEPATLVALVISMWAGTFMAYLCDIWGEKMSK